MMCPRCQNSVADDANFCDKCGAPLSTGGTQSSQTRAGKPKKLLLPIAALAILILLGGTTAYFFFVKEGKFEVTVQKITRDEAWDIETNTTVKVYCREFPRECSERGYEEVQRDVRVTLSRILAPVTTKDARITYKNNTEYPITINRFLYRNAPGRWKGEAGRTQRRYAPKVRRLRSVIEGAKGNVPFETKLDFATTLALIEFNAVLLQPGEQRTWRLGYTDRSEFQVEYIQNDKTYRTPVLRPK